jgi:excisionase family DNA binding protein
MIDTRQSECNVAPRLLLRPQEAANTLGVSLRTLMSFVASGDIPYTRIGERNLRFPVDALREWVARRTTWPNELVASEGSHKPATKWSCSADCSAGSGAPVNHRNSVETFDFKRDY